MYMDLKTQRPFLFHAEVVPVPNAENEVRAVIHVVLKDRKESFDARSFALASDQEMIRQVLAADPPAWAVIPQLFECPAQLVMSLQLALPEMVEIAIFRETSYDGLDIAHVNPPGVFREQLLNVEPVFD